MNEGLAGREVPFEDQRMWRLLLARLHPDAGGDRELFLFACALREEALGNRDAGRTLGKDARERKSRPTAEPLLRAWHEAMSCWASRNRETLKRFVAGEASLAATDDLAIPEQARLSSRHRLHH